ncbi:MAG: 30S ribosomal protein S12 methylthiotransferase RimO [Lachnospiraceae bacterium]|nr:30S ribosomal protein S12 methylthiotransferase RimO [Lachnospiraceae bacterium]
MKILFISLGCDKNTVDSEMMLGILSDHGHTITDSEEDADVAVINTCCFIGDAKRESIDNILQMVELKKSGRLKAVIVTGCLGQRYTEDIHKEIPEVDAILGIGSFDKIADCIDEVTAGKCNEDYSFDSLADINGPVLCGYDRLLTSGGHYAYLKIAEGCNKRCTYCVIPKVRGSYRSVPMEILTDEAAKLAERGVKELILVAQETTLYGVDIYGKKSLHVLLEKLAKIEDIKWIRILYCYPEEIYDELVETIKNEPKVCHYLDIPIQHASDDVLRAMARKTNRAEITERICKLRKTIPDIALRTTFITGFPGEKRSDHLKMLDFVRETGFDRLGVFTYSREEGTIAGESRKQIPEFIKKRRRNAVMKLQQQIAYKKAESMIGEELEVMIEGRLVEDDIYVGRTYKDAPGVDGMIFVESDGELMSGDFVTVRVTGSKGYDLIGEVRG